MSRPSLQPFAALGRPESVEGLPFGQVSQPRPDFGLWSGTFGNNVVRGNSLSAYVNRTILTGPDVNPLSSEHLGSTLVIQVMSQQNWQTGVVAPYRLTNKERADWIKTTFQPQLGTETGHFGVGRVLSSTRDNKSAVLNRFAVGYRMDSELMKTAEGEVYHAAYLTQMANTIEATCQADVCATLVGAHDYERTEIARRGLMRNISPETYMRLEAANFACLQKDRIAFHKLDVLVNGRLEKINGRANTWIVPYEISGFMAVTPKSYTVFNEAGPAGPRGIRNTDPRDSSEPWANFEGSQVFISRSFQTDQIPENPFQNRHELGEFYPMRNPPPLRDVRYRSSMRTIHIYDYTTDSFKPISLLDALNNAQLFDKTSGAILPVDGNLRYFSGMSVEEDILTRLDANNINEINRFGDLDTKYQTADQILEIGRSLRAIVNESSFLEGRIATGKALVDRLRTLSGANLDNIDFTNATVAGQIARRIGDAAGPVFGVPALEQCPSTGFIKVPTDFKLNALVPGLHSWHGLKFLAAYGGEPLKAEREEATTFISAFKELANKLSALFPDSDILKKENASSYWHYPERETTLFEHLYTGYEPPIFVAKGGEVSPRAAVEEMAQTSSPEFKINCDAVDWNSPVASFKAGAITAIGRFLSGSKENTEVHQKSLAGALHCKINSKAPQQLTPNLDAWGGKTIQSADAALVTIIGELAEKHVSFETIRDNISEFSQVVKKNLDGVDGERTFVQTPFVASAAFAAQLYDSRDRSYAIGNPYFHETIMDEHLLDKLTQHIAERTTNIGTEQRLAARRNIAQLPTWTSARTLNNTALYVNKMNTLVGSSLADHEITQGRVDTLHVGALPDQARLIRSLIASSLPRLKDAVRIGAMTADPANTGVANKSLQLDENYTSIYTSSAVDSLTKDLALAYLFANITLPNVKAMIDADIRIPFDFIITRPHITFDTLTAVKVQVDGGATMQTLVGPATFEMQNDAKTHTHAGDVVWHAKPVIMIPENVCVAQNIFVNGVRSGLRMDFVDPENYNASSGVYDGGSIIVIAISQNDTIDGNLFALNGTLVMPDFGQLGLGKKDQAQYSTASRYNRIYGWMDAIYGAHHEQIPQSLEYTERRWNNMLCMPGAFISCDYQTGAHTVFNRGRGHLAGLCYPGCAEVLDGLLKEVKENPWAGYRIV